MVRKNSNFSGRTIEEERRVYKCLRWMMKNKFISAFSEISSKLIIKKKSNLINNVCIDLIWQE